MNKKIVAFTPYSLIDTHPFYKYLTEERGVTPAEIEKYQIGFALDFLHERGRLNNPNNKDIIEYRVKDKKRYPKFSNRIMFPIKNIRGEIIAFSGRSLDPEQPKYFNSSESLQFEKKKSFFGLREAIDHPKMKNGLVMIVEGQIDCIKGNRYLPTLAPMGKFTPSHAKILSDFGVKRVLVVGDNDKAGKTFNIEACKSLLEVDILPTVGIFKKYSDFGETNNEPLKEILDFKTVYDILIAPYHNLAKKDYSYEQKIIDHFSSLNLEFLKFKEAITIDTLLAKESRSIALKKFMKIWFHSVGMEQKFSNIETLTLSSAGFTLHTLTPRIDDNCKEIKFFNSKGKEVEIPQEEQEKIYKIGKIFKQY